MQLLPLSLKLPNKNCAIPTSYCEQISVIAVGLSLWRKFHNGNRVLKLILNLRIVLICRYSNLLLTTEPTAHAAESLLGLMPHWGLECVLWL